MNIAIIGAGIAGLSCARYLKNIGVDLHVYEKSRNCSGRMSTRHHMQWSVDHGAQYFTARDPIFLKEVEEWMSNDVAAPWVPRLKVFDGKQWLNSHSTDTRFVGTPNMTAPGEYLAKNLNINFNQTINNVEHKNGNWIIYSQETGKIKKYFDFLIVAIPAAQAQILINNVNGENVKSVISKFSKSAEMKGCWTLMLKPISSLDIEMDAAFINNEIISWVCRNNSKPMRQNIETWIVHANPKWSQEFINVDKNLAANLILQNANKIGFNFSGAEYSVHRWRYASGYLLSTPKFHISLKQKIAFCGDWLHGGRVEGAWLSGRALAQEIANHF